MKIDNRRPLHWLWLCGFLVQSILGLMLRWRRSTAISSAKPVVVLYGHKLNGNLLALYRYMQETDGHGLKPVFLTMDAAYHRELLAQGVDCQWAVGMGCSGLLTDAVAFVSDHGLHSLQLLHGAYRASGLLFFDVWHGIPFKGFDGDDFRLQRRYDEIWVVSELLRDLYVRRFGFEPGRVVVTGYARTDRLVRPVETNSELRRRHGVPAEGKLILFAPTWAQDAKGRSIYPFGHEEQEFLGAFSALAQRHGATVLMRSHLNSGDDFGRGYANVVQLPSGRYPDAESILLMSDMLVCDWSSIAFDYLLLDRIAFFLDVEPPFRKGFSLGPEYRFSTVVGSLLDLLRQIEACLVDPSVYRQANGNRHMEVRRAVYGEWADGGASQRCVERLLAVVSSGSSR